MRTASIVFVTLVFIGSSLVVPGAEAGIVTTSRYLDEQQVAAQRAEIIGKLQREEVQAQLADMGVDTAIVESRVAALSDSEVAAMHADMAAMPAGADISNTTLILLILLIILLV